MLLLALTVLTSACGTMQAELAPVGPRAGLWSLEYTGGCAGREAERLLITQLDDGIIAFDDFQLLRNEAGEYVGSANFIAPMPVDGREIPYEIAYALNATEAGRFAGTETVTEGGGHSLGCPIELVFSRDS